MQETCGFKHPLSEGTCGFKHYNSEIKVESADLSTIFSDLICELEHHIQSENLRIRASYYFVRLLFFQNNFSP